MHIFPMNPLAPQLASAVRLLEKHGVSAGTGLSWSTHSAHPIYSIGNRVMVFGPNSPQRPVELMLLMFNEYHRTVDCACQKQ